MTKRHFIELADLIKLHREHFNVITIELLADFCEEQNPLFNRKKWIAYVQRKEIGKGKSKGE